MSKICKTENNMNTFNDGKIELKPAVSNFKKEFEDTIYCYE